MKEKTLKRKNDLNVNFERRKIYVYSVVYLAVMGLLLAGVLFIFSRRMKGEMERQATNILKDASQSNERIFNHEIQSKLEVLSRVAGSIVDSGLAMTKDEADRLFETALVLYDFKDIGFIQQDGQSYSIQKKSYDFSQADFFKESMKGESIFTETFEDSNDGKRINVYSVPVKNGNTVLGVLYAVYDTDKLGNLFSSSFQGNGYSYVVDKEGQVMLSENSVYENIFVRLKGQEENKAGIQKMADDLAHGREGHISVITDTLKYAYYKPLTVNDWFIIMIVPMDEVSVRSRPIMSDVLGICVIIVIMFGLGAGHLLYLQGRQRKLLEYYAYVDPMTGGSNNARFYIDAVDRLSRLENKKAAILAVDIKRFKVINELWGFATGNQIIRRMNERLLKHMKEGEILAHRIADQFKLLWIYDNRPELMERLDMLCQDMEQPMDEIPEIFIQLAVGVQEFERREGELIDQRYVEQMYSDALLANQAIKSKDGVNCNFLSGEIKLRQMRNKLYEDSLHRALENNEFIAWFQPKVDLSNGKITGAEALVRWERPDKTMILPGEFIPIFEANGSIEKIDREVFRYVIKMLAEWKKLGLPIVPISVNLSRGYSYAENFSEGCRKYMEARGLNTSAIEFEITETAAEADKERLKNTIDRLHDNGFSVLLDDFGTGYSSMLSLYEFNIDTVKLDRSFISKIGDSRMEKILEASIGLGKALGMKIIAEGVETQEQLDYLRLQNVPQIQGYYFYKPLAAKDFASLLAATDTNFYCLPAPTKQ